MITNKLSEVNDGPAVDWCPLGSLSHTLVSLRIKPPPTTLFPVCTWQASKQVSHDALHDTFGFVKLMNMTHILTCGCVTY